MGDKVEVGIFFGRHDRTYSLRLHSHAETD